MKRKQSCHWCRALRNVIQDSQGALQHVCFFPWLFLNRVTYIYSDIQNDFFFFPFIIQKREGGMLPSLCYKILLEQTWLVN